LTGWDAIFYGRKNGALYLSSELKSLIGITDEIYEFPPGYYMDSTYTLFQFAELPQSQPEILKSDLDEIIATIKDIIQRSFNNRIDFKVPTGSLLSGGIDSSVISERYQESSRLG